jgi:hypothetical protein
LSRKSKNFKNRNFVGIQIGLVSFLDEGVEETLDILEEKAHVNALIPSTVSWSRGNAGRATDWYPDHGKAEPDNLEGGGMIDIDPKYYKNTFLDDYHARDELYQDVDFLELIGEEAQKRDMAIYPYYCETSRIEPRHINIPGWVHVLEIDAYGRRTGRPCVNNPEHIGWWRSVLEHHFKEYDLDGFLWGIERKGPLFLTMDGQETTCFCRHCQERARNEGIDVDAAREGLKKLDEFFKSVRAGHKPTDGYLVEMLRLLLHNPAVVQYEKMWHESHKDLAREVYGLIKWLQPDAYVGQMVWQYINTFNPFLRAQWDLTEFTEFADWVKPVMYHIPAGPRMHGIVDGYTDSWLGDFDNDEALRVLYNILQLDEPAYDELVDTGFSAEYVKNETARTVRAMAPDVQVYPGIGVGVQGIGDLRITPEDVKDCVKASYRGGATGITICRNYSEASLDCMEAVGDALDELGIDDTIPEGISEVEVERRAETDTEDKDVFAS